PRRRPGPRSPVARRAGRRRAGSRRAGRRRTERDRERERRALARLALDPQLAAVRLDDALADVEAEAGALLDAVALRGPAPREPVGPLPRREPGAGVGHADPHRAAGPRAADEDRVARPAVLLRVPEQVGEHLLHAIAIAIAPQGHALELGLE